MVGWHHRLNGHEFEQVPGLGDGRGSLECCCPWGHKELDHKKKLSTKELMLLNYDVGEDSWESLGQQDDQTSQS